MSSALADSGNWGPKTASPAGGACPSGGWVNVKVMGRWPIGLPLHLDITGSLVNGQKSLVGQALL